jgi:predicted nuclease with RNAse H fold
MSSEGVEVVSNHPTATEAIHVGAYCALDEMARRRPHQGWRIEAPGRR